MLIFYCFLRPAEIMRMKAEDVDYARKTINVRGAMSKNRKTAVVAVPELVIELLRESGRDKAEKDFYLFTKKLKPGKQMAAPTRMAEIWRKWANDNGIDKCIYHLKHTGVGMAIEAGMNLRDLQLQLRHHSLDMTQIYLDKFRREPGEAMRRCFPRI